MLCVWESEFHTITGTAWCMKVQKISFITYKELITLEIKSTYSLSTTFSKGALLSIHLSAMIRVYFCFLGIPKSSELENMTPVLDQCLEFKNLNPVFISKKPLTMVIICLNITIIFMKTT